MRVFNKILLLLFFIFCFSDIFAQQDSINPNGFNVFYYPNGFKLSEGNLKAGKPDGYWITYYVNGKKKSEGNRKNFMLDSLWIFYAENGDTTETINYLENKKNGYYTKYYTRFDSVKNNSIKSKELYLNDKRQGYSYYYYKNGKLKEKIKYKDNYKNGKGFEYDKNGKLIALDEYRYNNLVSRKAVNRTDRKGEKIGTWVDVYKDGKIKTEINFQDGMPNGNYKEYSPSGKMIKLEKFVQGKLISKNTRTKYDTLALQDLKQKKEFYSNGQLKSLKTYKDSVLFGMQLFYSKNGHIQRAEIYDELGIKTGQGKVDSLSRKQGEWTFFFDSGIKRSQGKFKDNKKTGNWIYYYENGKVFETGTYEDGYPVGQWTWYYPSEKILRVEHYVLGDKSGITYELSEQGDTIVKGNYKEGAKHGKWFYKIGDEYSTGKYYFGQKIDTWKVYYYPEMRLKCKTEYVDGKKDGRHRCYYLNKKLKEIGAYSNGKKSGKWTYYKPDGNIDYTAEYLRGVIQKVNDIPIK